MLTKWVQSRYLDPIAQAETVTSLQDVQIWVDSSQSQRQPRTAPRGVERESARCSRADE